MLDDFTLKLLEIVSVCAASYGAMIFGLKDLHAKHIKLHGKFKKHVRDRRVHK